MDKERYKTARVVLEAILNQYDWPANTDWDALADECMQAANRFHNKIEATEAEGNGHAD